MQLSPKEQKYVPKQIQFIDDNNMVYMHAYQ